MTATTATTNTTNTGRRLEIDWTRCDGHGLCHALAPELIDLDEWGFPILRSGTPTDRPDEPTLRRIVAACPALALRLTPVVR